MHKCSVCREEVAIITTYGRCIKCALKNDPKMDRPIYQGIVMEFTTEEKVDGVLAHREHEEKSE
jgi:hypothetical protein